MQSPEQQARADIDRLLRGAGWAVHDYRSANVHAARRVAIREFGLAAGSGTADDLRYVDGKACGVIEAKRRGTIGSGKTFTAISFIDRLIKHADVRCVSFLLDRGNLGRQIKNCEAGIRERPLGVRATAQAGLSRTALDFRRSSRTKAAKVDPCGLPANDKFGKGYIVQHLTNTNLDKATRVYLHHPTRVLDAH